MGSGWRARALARQSAGELEAGVECFRQSLAIKPEQPRTLTNLGHALHQKGETQAAAECFAQALRLDPNYAIALNNMAVVLQSQSEFGESAAYLRRALAVHPSYPEAHCNRGTALRAQGDRAWFASRNCCATGARATPTSAGCASWSKLACNAASPPA